MSKEREIVTKMWKKTTIPAEFDHSYVHPIEVHIEGSSREDFEHACRKFKILFQRERIVGQLKDRSSYEKPSAKKRRKTREAQDRQAMLVMREQMIKTGEWDRRQRQKAKNKIRKEEKKAGSLNV